MPEIANAKVQFKRMTREQWQTSTYIAAEGELVTETDTGFVKIGDGRSRYPQLRYLTGPQGEQGVPGVQGPPGRDGVVTFENLTEQQRNSLRGADGERGHSLNASVRIEGSYKNNATSQLNLFADVFYDSEIVTSGYTIDYYYRGFGNNNWQVLRNQTADSTGKFSTWSASQRVGGWFEVRIEVTYRGLKTSAFARIDNINDGARGSDGERGQNSYIHTKYSDNSNGANMDNDSNRQYIGIYVGYQEVPPVEASEYSWTKIRGNDGKDSLPIHENLLPNSDIGNSYNKTTWENQLVNSGLNISAEHATQNFGRGLHIYGTATSLYKGLASKSFILVAKQGDKLTLSMDLGQDDFRDQVNLQVGLHYLNDTNQTLSQEWKYLDTAIQGLEVNKYKRISFTFTVGADMKKCRLMIFATPNKNVNSYIDNIKLERGEVATTWYPAYFDLQNPDIPVFRIAKGDINGTGEAGQVEVIDKNYIINANGVKIGDIVQDVFLHAGGTTEGFWEITNISGSKLTLKGLGMRNLARK